MNDGNGGVGSYHFVVSGNGNTAEWDATLFCWP